MNESTSDSETSTPDEGPASIREALLESYDEHVKATTESESKDQADDEPEQLDTSDEHEAEDSSSESVEESSDDDESEDQHEEPVIQAPDHWSDEDRETFGGLPSAAQEYLLKREKQYEKGIQEKAEALKPFQDALQPYRSTLQMRGMTEAQAVKAWANAQAMLDSDPVNALKALVSQYGEETAQKLATELGFQTGTQEEFDEDDSELTPAIKRMQDELKALKSENQQLQTRFRTDEQSEAVRQVQEFREAKDDDGNLIHPHFEALHGTMKALLDSGAATDLPSAYEQAVWTVPEFREQFEKQKIEAAEAAAAKKREEAAKKAKKTAKTVTGKASKPPPKKQAATLHDDLNSAWDENVRGA